MTMPRPARRRRPPAGLLPRLAAALPAAALLVVPWAPALAQAPDSQGMAVSVVAARRQCFHDRVLATGFLAARRAVELRADRDGLMVGEVLAGPGDMVVADQVLARLVSPPGAPLDTGTVKAPLKGTVVAVSAPVGAYASPSQREPMFRIEGEDGLELKADVLASRLPRLKEGQAARVQVLGLGALEGRLTAVGAGVDAATQFGTVSLAVSDPRLRSGAFARAEIDAGEDCGFAVPLSALLSTPDGTVVGVVRDDEVEMRRVKVGLIEGGAAEVREGLAEGEPVVARAGAFLRDGDRVRAIPDGPPAAGSP